jgi:acetyl esterase/lipase
MFNLVGNMMNEIENDWDYPMRNPTIDSKGMRHWRDVIVAKPLGYRPLTAMISAPKSSKPLPLVIYIHGGAWFIGHPAIQNRGYQDMDFINKILNAGFAVARITYRFSMEAKFPTQLHDCKAAVRYLHNHAKTFNIDPTRIAAMGDSAGGHLALMLGVTGNNPQMEGAVGEKEGSSAVKAVVNWFGPTDFLNMQNDAITNEWQDHNDAKSPESILIGGALQDHPEKARFASPLHHVNASAPPMLHQHGKKDRLVPFKQAQRMHDALVAVGVHSELHAIADADHCFWGAPDPAITERAITFLKAQV